MSLWEYDIVRAIGNNREIGLHFSQKNERDTSREYCTTNGLLCIAHLKPCEPRNLGCVINAKEH